MAGLGLAFLAAAIPAKCRLCQTTVGAQLSPVAAGAFAEVQLFVVVVVRHLVSVRNW